VAAALREAPVSFSVWIAAASRADSTESPFALSPFPPNALSGDLAGSFGYGVGLNVWTDGDPGSALSVENVGYTFTNDGGAFEAGKEYFVVASIGVTTAAIYVDAVKIAEEAASTPGAAAVANLYVGRHNDDQGYGSRNYFRGRMRDARIYKRALTAAEVATLHGAGPAAAP
jgi:hypothetical protein